MSKTKAVLVGAVESSRVALAALERAEGWTVAAVVTLAEDLSSRHSDHADLAGDAERIGAPLIRVENINAADALARVGGAGADHILVVGWSQICGAAFRALAPGRVIGYHPAPLPRMRGRAALPWTILRDEPISAGTLFWIDEGTDTGAVLDQSFFHVAPLETAASLYAKHMAALTMMLDRSLAAIARGEERRVPQDEACATWCARRGDADGAIDWTRPAEEVLRLVRAVGRPYPGAHTETTKRRVRIWAGETCGQGARHAARHAARPGQVVAADAESFTVLCGDGTTLRVREWSDAPPRLHAMLGGAR